MRNPTAGPPQAGSDGRWTAREPVAWRDDAGSGRRQAGAARDVARSGDATDPLARCSAEHGKWHRDVVASGAGGVGGGRADRAVWGVADPGGAGGRTGSVAGGA